MSGIPEPNSKEKILQKSLIIKAIQHDLRGEHSLAQKIYHEILQVTPKNKSILNNLALSYWLNDQLELAERTVESCSKCTNLKKALKKQM